jgi:hypothetical protein
LDTPFEQHAEMFEFEKAEGIFFGQIKLILINQFLLMLCCQPLIRAQFIRPPTQSTAQINLGLIARRRSDGQVITLIWLPAHVLGAKMEH